MLVVGSTSWRPKGAEGATINRRLSRLVGLDQCYLSHAALNSARGLLKEMTILAKLAREEGILHLGWQVHDVQWVCFAFALHRELMEG